MNSIGLFFFISLTFSPLAAASAFLITYEEYKKHVKPRQAVKHALHMAFFTFFVFMAIGVIAGFFFSNMFASQ